MNVWTAILFALTLPISQQQSALSAKDLAALKPGPGVAIFKFEGRGADAPHWSIDIGVDGSGRYVDLAGNAQRAADAPRAIHIGDATHTRLNAGYDAVLGGKCETKEKNIANSGAKHLAYSMRNGDVWSECTFNYSDDEKLNDVAAAFQAIAETMQAGERLKHKHRFDHLGLDAELDSLLAAAKDGRAIELQNIAPILKSIVDDDEMMSPSRRKAKSLLELAGVHAEPGV